MGDNGIMRARQTLIDRGYLEGAPGGIFDADTETAAKRLQQDYVQEETGVIDPVTLVALYYDKAAVEEQLARYPAPAAK